MTSDTLMQVSAKRHPHASRALKVSRSVDGGQKALKIETDARHFRTWPGALLVTAFWIFHAVLMVQLARESYWVTWVAFFVCGIPVEWALTMGVLLHFFGRRVVCIAGNSGTAFVGIGPVGWRRRFAVTEKSRLRIGRLYDMGYTWHHCNNPPGILLRNGKKRLCIYRDADDALVRQVFQILTDEFPSMAPKKRKSKPTPVLHDQSFPRRPMTSRIFQPLEPTFAVFPNLGTMFCRFFQALEPSFAFSASSLPQPFNLSTLQLFNRCPLTLEP